MADELKVSQEVTQTEYVDDALHVSQEVTQAEYVDDALHVAQELVQVEYGTTRIFVAQTVVQVEYYMAWQIVVQATTREVMMAGQDMSAAAIAAQQSDWCQDYQSVDTNVLGWGYGQLSTADADIYENVDLPDGFVPYCWKYSVGEVWSENTAAPAQTYIDRRLLGDAVVVLVPSINVVAENAILTDGVTTAAVTLTWDRVYNALQYEVRYRKTGDTTYTLVPAFGDVTASTTITIPGLIPGQEYSFQVRALTNTGIITTWSSAVLRTTASGLSTALLPTTATLTGTQTLTNKTFSDPVTLGQSSAPAGVADKAHMYAADVAAGNTAPHFRTENGGVIKLFTAATVAAVNAATATSIAATVPGAAPAGGTGTAAGAWDTAENRDAAITTINGLRDHAIEMDLDYEALVVDVADVRTKVNDVLTKIKSHGLIAT